MGTWVVIHYGMTYGGAPNEAVCGAVTGDAPTRSVLTWRPYEIETDEHIGGYPEGSKVCAQCRDIVVTSKLVDTKRERRRLLNAIAVAKREIPGLWSMHKWRKLADIAYAAAVAKEDLKRRKTPATPLPPMMRRRSDP